MPSQPAAGMPIAVPTIVAVRTQEISSSPAERSPCIWGNTALAIVALRVCSAPAMIIEIRMTVRRTAESMTVAGASPGSASVAIPFIPALADGRAAG